MRKLLLFTLGLALTASAQAFCGFYVGKADANLFNEASQVVVARDGDKTVVSMLNDYKGELKEFALVVPVPSVLQRGQIHVGDKKIFDRLDAYSAPRLAEYYPANAAFTPPSAWKPRWQSRHRQVPFRATRPWA